MVLTDRQRADLHAGIYEYLLSRGPSFAAVASALAEVDPDVQKTDDKSTPSSSTPESTTTPTKSSLNTPLLEKKWTAVPRLQKRVLELEKQLSSMGKVRPSSSGVTHERRLLPRTATHTLQSHSAPVTHLSLHPHQTVACSSSEDGTLKLWDYESGLYLKSLRGHTNIVTSCNYSPTGMFLVSASTDMSIKLWDMENHVCVRTLRGHDHGIYDVKFVPPEIGALYLNNSNSGSGSDKASGITASAAGAKFIVSASRDGTIKFWDVETGFCDATVGDHGDWVRCLAVRGARVKTANNGGKDSESEQEVSTDSLVLVASSGNDRTIYVYNAYEKRQKIAELRGHDHVIEALSFLCSDTLPQEKKVAPPTRSKTSTTPNTWDYLASASRDRTVKLWSVSNGGSCLMTFSSHENWVKGVTIHPSGNYVLSCGDDRTIRVFDIKVRRNSCWHSAYEQSSKHLFVDDSLTTFNV